MKLKSEIPAAADPLERPKRKDFVKVKQLKKKVIFDLYNTLNMQIEVFILPAFVCPVFP